MNDNCLELDEKASLMQFLMRSEKIQAVKFKDDDNAYVETEGRYVHWAEGHYVHCKLRPLANNIGIMPFPSACFDTCAFEPIQGYTGWNKCECDNNALSNMFDKIMAELHQGKCVIIGHPNASMLQLNPHTSVDEIRIMRDLMSL